MTLPRLLLVLLLLLPSGGRAGDPPAHPAGRDFGAGLTLDRPTPLTEVFRSPERFESRRILLRGRVSDICQRKGCWTILKEGEAHVRVRFQDYGFFLPKDAIGAEALVEGFGKVQTLSERTVRHYESESRNGDPDAVTGPRREVGFTASGVRLLEPREKAAAP